MHCDILIMYIFGFRHTDNRYRFRHIKNANFYGSELTLQREKKKKVSGGKEAGKKRGKNGRRKKEALALVLH